MLGKIKKTTQRDLFLPFLSDFIDETHELVLLANKIDWVYFEEEFKGYYSDKPSRPSMPIRLMVGCLMLKQLYNLSDERLPEYWVRDVYPDLSHLHQCEILQAYNHIVINQFS